MISIVYSSIHSSFPFDPFHSYSKRIDLFADVWRPTATTTTSTNTKIIIMKFLRKIAREANSNNWHFDGELGEILFDLICGGAKIAGRRFKYTTTWRKI